MRASDTPRVLSPGILSTLANVTTDPTELLITAGLARPLKKNQLRLHLLRPCMEIHSPLFLQAHITSDWYMLDKYCPVREEKTRKVGVAIKVFVPAALLATQRSWRRSGSDATTPNRAIKTKTYAKTLTAAMKITIKRSKRGE